MECATVTAGHKKAKKKQVKDEFDRIKQAEKKKRRLEKALATSAAIRSELERKKLQKKQEQERLDEQGAAIAEAVALQVLLGEDSDESSSNMLLKQNESWYCASNRNIIMAARHRPVHYNDLSKYSCDNIERLSHAHDYEPSWDGCGNFDFIGSSDHLESGFYAPYFGDECLGTVDISAGHVAAQAVSALKLAEGARVEAYAFNGILRG